MTTPWTPLLSGLRGAPNSRPLLTMGRKQMPPSPLTPALHSGVANSDPCQGMPLALTSGTPGVGDSQRVRAGGGRLRAQSTQFGAGHLRPGQTARPLMKTRLEEGLQRWLRMKGKIGPDSSL